MISLVSRTTFKRKNENFLIKNYIYRYEDDTILLRSLLLSNKDKDKDYPHQKNILCEKFGKELSVREMWLSSETINAMMFVLNQDYEIGKIISQTLTRKEK